MSTPLLENRYQILQELGQGGFGETFLAEDLHMPSNRRCVIKQLKPVTNDPAVYQIVKDRFQREAVLLERLGEGNRQIPSLYAYFTEGGRFYLVQEWIEGETLSQILANTGLWSSDQVFRLLVGILPVLDFIHDQGIVHRDIKPDNILLRKGDRQPVLIDFGAVKETMGTQMNSAGQTTSSIVIGTPGFMSSEQAIGRPVFSSDLYSLGLTAIYLLTGKLPNDFPSDPATGKILWRDSSPTVDNHLAQVLDQAISNHPRDRFSNATAMLRALQSSQSATVATPLPAPIPETIAPAAAILINQPTVPSIPPTPAIAPDTNPPQTYPDNPAPTQKKAMADWQKAILTGGVIGAFLLGAIVINEQFNNQDNSSHTTPVAENPNQSTSNGNTNTTPTTEKPDQSTSNGNTTTEPTPEQPTTETPQATPEAQPVEPVPSETQPTTETKNIQQINKLAAEAVVVAWLKCKNDLFDSPYDRTCGNDVLTGKAYESNIKRSDGDTSSVEWLEKNHAYYVFDHQTINSIDNFQMVSENEAIVELVVTEQRSLYDANDQIDNKASGYDQRLIRYTLRWSDNTWKIADYDTLKVLWEQ